MALHSLYASAIAETRQLEAAELSPLELKIAP
jgi:hypothetical protein